MSNSNSKKSWFSSIFTSTQSDSTCSLPLTSSEIKKSRSIFPQISKTSDLDYNRITNNNLKASAVTSSPKFISLQRLDSVGGTMSEPSRFSYPPSKGETDSYLMSNLLQSSWLQKGLSDSHDSTILPRKTNSQTFLGNSFSQVSHYLMSTLHRLTEKVATGVVRPTNLSNHSSNLVSRETNFPMDKLQKFGESDSHLKLIKLPDDVKHITSYTVTCVKPSTAASNAKKLGTFQSEPVCESSVFSESQTGITKVLSTSDTNCSEFVMREHENPLKGDLQSDSTLNFSRSHIDIDCPAIPLCTSHPADNDQDETMRCVSLNSCSSDDDDYKSVSEDDCCSESNFSFSASAENFSEHSATTDDEWSDSECKVIDDTDSDNGFCPWDRLTSNRTPWTCGQFRKAQSKDKSGQLPFEPFAQPGHDELDVEFEKDEVKPMKHRNSNVQFLPVYKSELKDTVSRPACSNSDISFILGWPDDNGYDSDDEDNLSWCSEPERCEFDSCAESCTFTDSTACCQNQCSTGAKEATVGNNPCRLWDYFANQCNPLSSMASAISDLCPSSPRKDKTVRRARVPSDRDNPTDFEGVYKAPSKVSQSAAVIVNYYSRNYGQY